MSVPESSDAPKMMSISSILSNPAPADDSGHKNPTLDMLLDDSKTSSFKIGRVLNGTKAEFQTKTATHLDNIETVYRLHEQTEAFAGSRVSEFRFLSETFETKPPPSSDDALDDDKKRRSRSNGSIGAMASKKKRGRRKEDPEAEEQAKPVTISPAETAASFPPVKVLSQATAPGEATELAAETPVSPPKKRMRGKSKKTLERERLAALAEKEAADNFITATTESFTSEGQSEFQVEAPKKKAVYVPTVIINELGEKIMLKKDGTPMKKRGGRRKKAEDEPEEDDKKRRAEDEDEDEIDGDGKPKRRKRRTKEEIEEDNAAAAREKLERAAVRAAKKTGPEAASRPEAESEARPEAEAETETRLETTPEDDTPRIRSLRLTIRPKATTKEARALEKQYDNIYLSVWKDMSRKDGPKVSRLLQQASQAKLVNLRKTAILAAREAKRWQVKTNKSQKDLTTKARRAMREMLNFWKRNEREEKELRKRAEKELVDKAKREEDAREAKRQSRKLNFLITQTELYSHFIGKKIRTDEIENAGEHGPVASTHGLKSGYDIEAPSEAVHTDLHSIDFENEKDEDLVRQAAANAQSALLATQGKARAFNGDAANGARADANGSRTTPDDDDDLNFQNPTSLGDISIEQPKLLSCTLKEYQVKGLNWLANLYDQGINGILADEMGLGKTVQSIAVLAYLAETHGIWGPFLVVSPASTLHNWQQEIAKFVPDFKVLPYWGTGKDRKVLRKFWDRKNPTYAKDAPFHVMVTSYQMVVADAQYFQRMKWQYMILDEAQAIKSSSSSRWKSLLSFQCRNRLLLTGTPIQNNMQELWALLHFIMPSLFDSHDEFSDWFAKDIESHATSGAQLNEQQLRRLHVILKPFMLRRIKKNVQSELGDKIEIDVYCGMTNRQKKLYHMLKSQISVRDLIERARGEDGAQSLMNLVMQFRKVCNHPDLFERADTSSPFSFATFASTASFVREAALPQLDVQYTAVNQIAYRVPKVVYREMLSPHWNNTIGSKQKVLEMMSVYREENMAKETRGWLGLVDCTTQEFTQLAKQDELARSIRGNRITHSQIEDGLIEELYGYASPHKRLLITHESGGKSSSTAGQKVIQEVNLVDGSSTDSDSDLSSVSNSSSLFNVQSNTYTAMHLNTLDPAAISPASAPPVDIICSDASFAPQRDDTLFNRELRSALMPMPLSMELGLMEQKVPLSDYPPANMLPQPLNAKTGHASIQMPSMERFITESGKLSKLDELLVDLKANDHRVLLYFQMTKMMDLMEEYLTYKSYKYIRLDGSSKLGDRRDLVHDWQTKPEIFIFILSTRAGGLGINLTAADTVIFYDSDWNPTIDSQAMDRAHRLGQTRQVTVYRLLVKGTIEERMRDRAKQKEHVQQVVMEGKAAPAPSAKDDKREVAMWLLDNDEDADEVLGASEPSNKRIREISGKARNSKLEDMYHEGEGEFDDGSSAAPSRMDSPRN